MTTPTKTNPTNERLTLNAPMAGTLLVLALVMVPSGAWADQAGTIYQGGGTVCVSPLAAEGAHVPGQPATQQATEVRTMRDGQCAGSIVCTDNPAVLGDIGGACNIDCTGQSGHNRCVITNTNGADLYKFCYDSNGDGVDDVCTPAATGILDHGYMHLGNVYVLGSGTFGEIQAMTDAA